MTVLSPAKRHYPALAPAQTRSAGATAEIVRRLLGKVVQHESDRANDWRATARAKIIRLVAECSERNWDGHGAAPVSAAAADYALRLVDVLPAYLPPPDVLPDVDGEVSFYWDFGPDRVFTVSIGQRAMLSYAGLLGRGVQRHGQEPFEDDVADLVIESIRQVASVERASS